MFNLVFQAIKNIGTIDGTYDASHESAFGHGHGDVLFLSHNPENLFCQKIVRLGKLHDYLLGSPWFHPA
jgi:hypothetical protein